MSQLGVNSMTIRGTVQKVDEKIESKTLFNIKRTVIINDTEY